MCGSGADEFNIVLVPRTLVRVPLPWKMTLPLITGLGGVRRLNNLPKILSPAGAGAGAGAWAARPPKNGKTGAGAG